MDNYTPKHAKSDAERELHRANLQLAAANETILELTRALEAARNGAQFYEMTRDMAYRDRSMVVAVLSKVWESHIEKDPEDPDFPVVCVHTPEGPVTWQITADERGMLFDHLVYEDKSGDCDHCPARDRQVRLNDIRRQW